MGGSDRNFAHNQLVRRVDAGPALLTGSVALKSDTSTPDSTPADPGGRQLAIRWTYLDRLYIFGGSRQFNRNDMYFYDGSQWVRVVCVYFL